MGARLRFLAGQVATLAVDAALLASQRQPAQREPLQV